MEFLKAGISTADVATILEDEWDETAKDWKPGTTTHNEVISIGFRRDWVNIMKSYNDESKFAKAVNRMIQDFGPVLVDGAKLGGSIFTAIKYDSLSIEDDFKVNGKVRVGVALAAITINGDINAGYSKKGTDIWQSSDTYCSVSGGDPDSYKAMLTQMDSDLPDRAALREAAQKWMASIRCSNDKNDNSDIISIEYTGIWNLFPFYVADEIQEYIVNYYKNKTLCVDLENMGVLKKNKKEAK